MEHNPDKKVVLPITDKEGLKGRFYFHCPGCKCGHMFEVPRWSFNGDMYKPTVNPSILYNGEKRCHSFVKDGKIQFLDDCFHELKNQTVDLEPV